MRFFILCVLCVGMCLSGATAQERCRVMFYNVENLFDTSDDPHTTDNEFTPTGKKQWTKARYTDKLRKIAEVIDSIGQGDLPVIVGLAEVENRWVLEDLIGKTVLADGNYGYVHRDSPDPRGIDVAMLYRKDYFQVTGAEFLRPAFPENPRIRTRDVLFASGVLGGDTLHFFVCHFPSMIGGEQQSEWRRVRVAETVRRKTDSLLALNPRAAIVVMGDLNGQANTQAQKALGSYCSDRRGAVGRLYNTGCYLLKKNYGSYRYKGNWQTLDHLIVSGGLLDGRSVWKADRRMEVYRAPFLLEEDKAHFGFKPRPTYRGPRYIGGYSDHLPVYCDFVRVRTRKVPGGD